MKKHNRNSRQIITIGLVVVMVATAGTSLAMMGGQGGKAGGKTTGEVGFPGCGGPEMKMERLAKKLDLSADQQAAIQKIHERSREESVSLRKDLMKLGHQLKGEMLADSPSEKTVLDLNSKIGEIETELKALKLKSRLAVRKELTAEQRDKMVLMKEKMKDGEKGPGRRGGRFGQGPGGPRGGRGDHDKPGVDDRN